MVAISSPVILRISAAATLPYSFVERTTRPLIQHDRFPHRGRQKLLASDMASLLNAILGGQPADAVENDTMLRACEYISSLPPTAEQRPELGEGNWGELLERLIEKTQSRQDYANEPTDSSIEIKLLPHIIEVCLNPLSIVLVWHGPDGGRTRLDFYSAKNSDLANRSRVYGPATLLVRKSFLHPEMIKVASDILRDSQMSRKKTMPPKKGSSAPTDKPKKTSRHTTKKRKVVKAPTSNDLQPKPYQAAKPVEVLPTNTLQSHIHIGKSGVQAACLSPKNWKGTALCPNTDILLPILG